MLFCFNKLNKLLFLLFLSLFISQHSGWTDPWWSNKSVLESRDVMAGIKYELVLFETVLNEPVRAHIISVTASNSPYIFGVLGSFGTLFETSKFAKNSNAIVAVNGGFFSKNPTRGLGMIAAHGKILYPPQNSETFHGTVGFTPDQILFDWIKPSDISGNRIKKDNDAWTMCHAALGAGPILIKDGQAILEKSIDNFNIAQRAPRTAIGSTSDQKTVLMVIDGRQPAWSAGVTLEELMELFQHYQATNALNLDGGGSSTMVIQGEVVNKPSDLSFSGSAGIERAVANVIALFKK